MKVLVVPNFSKNRTAEILNEVNITLKKLSVDYIVNEDSGRPNFVIAPSLLHSCDVMLIIGGDGTILHSAKQAAFVGMPVLGINSGNLGFMAGVEPECLDELSKLITGEYQKERRIMLDIVAQCKDKQKHFLALNEVVITRSATSKIIDIDLRLDNNKFDNYRADGIMVSTPTGSTAYSLSAGGPILDPEIECMTLTPICPHSLVARSIVLSTKSVIEIIPTQEDENSEILLMVDGSDHITLASGSRVIVKKSEVFVNLIKLRNESFYKKINDKFLSF